MNPSTRQGRMWASLTALFEHVKANPENDFGRHKELFPYLFNDEDYSAKQKYTYYLLITNSKDKTDMGMVRFSLVIMALQEKGLLSRYEAGKKIQDELHRRKLHMDDQTAAAAADAEPSFKPSAEFKFSS